jgi:transaldolase
MRFFLDSASAEEARRIKDLALLDGVWLSVAAAEAAGVEYRKAVRELASLTDGPVLVELSADDPKGMYKEARELAKLGKDIVVRLPLKPEGLRVARLLSEDSVAACAAGCFSTAQALIAAKANLSYVAPAVGPLDDAGTIGMDLVEQVIRVYDNYGFQTQIVVSDARNPIHVLDAALMGADVAALPAAVLEQLFRHPFSAELRGGRPS